MEEKTNRGLDRLLLVEDLLVNVLSKLPVKSLLRFRCVCKRWLYLISEDPLFIQFHSRQSKSKPNLFFLKRETNPNPQPQTMALLSRDIEGNPIIRSDVKIDLGTEAPALLLSTCFDLVCIFDQMKQTVHICNPSTRESITLPPLPPFDGCWSTLGFGYVDSTEEYKVVRLITDQNLLNWETGVDAAPFQTKCQVFTLGTSWATSSSSSSGVWRDVMNAPYDVHDERPAFVNGALHWLVSYNSAIDKEVYHGHMIDPENTIVAFDVQSEEFRLLPHPTGYPDIRALQNVYLQLVDLRGLLSLSYRRGSKLDMWMLKDYENGTWMKEYSIDLNVLVDGCCLRWEDRLLFTPRDIDDTKVLIHIQCRKTGPTLGYYHLQSKSFKEFFHRDQQQILCFDRCSQFSFCLESLRSPKGKGLKQKRKRKRTLSGSI